MTEIFNNNFKLLLPESFLIITITLILIFAVAYNPSYKWNYPIMTSIVGWLSVQGLGITVLLLINEKVKMQMLLLGNTLIVDEITRIIKIIIIISAATTILIALDYRGKKKEGSYEHTILMLLSTWGMLFIVSSYDLISMYLAIELQSLCFYVIAASRRNNEYSVEAGLKYFILGALSSGFLLWGESLVYGITGITNFEEIAKYLLLGEQTKALIIGFLFILVAFLFKLGAVPFHLWTPDVYEGSPTSITAYFAITPKIAIMGLMLRLCYNTFWDIFIWWQEIIIWCAFLSMFFGTLGAINQNKIKRLFAFSSIAHVGYLLIALGTGSIEAIEGILVYLVIYILMIINIFSILLFLAKNTLSRKPLQAIYYNKIPTYGVKGMTSIKGENQSMASHITDISTLSKNNPVLALSAATLFFSNAGVPPLAGFYGKLLVFSAAVQQGLYLIALVGVLCSVMGAFYSIRLVKIMYYHNGTDMSTRIWYKKMSKETSIIMGVTFLLTLFFIIYPSFLFTITHSAAISLV